jgi:tetratricopeptide (TPR) repeat protein
MNKSVVCLFVLLSVQWILGCHGTDPAGGDNESIIMRSPSFAGLNDSIRQFPMDASLYFRRAELLSQINQHELASADFKRSWELKPVPETGLHYVSNLSILGRPSEKLRLLRDCIQHFPDNLEFSRLLGETYAESGRSKDALELYNNLLQKDSLDFETWYEKGLLLEEMKDTSEAIRALSKAFSLQPVNTYALELAHLYAEKKDPLALTICDQVIANDPARQLPDPFFIKGIYYSNIKQYNLAVLQFDSCIRRDWKFSDAYIEKGIAFFKQNNYDGALNTFRMAATVSNINPDAYYWIGRCYEAINKKDQAILNYERAAALDKNFKEAREALRRVRGN